MSMSPLMQDNKMAVVSSSNVWGSSRSGIMLQSFFLTIFDSSSAGSASVFSVVGEDVSTQYLEVAVFLAPVISSSLRLSLLCLFHSVHRVGAHGGHLCAERFQLDVGDNAELASQAGS